jgi:hypothetical protein
MAQRETEHLRALIAHERKDRFDMFRGHVVPPTAS